MGESVSTESQPPKLCSWILFPNGSQVKKKSRATFFGRNLLLQADLRDTPIFQTSGPILQKTPFQLVDFSLNKTKSGAYVIGRWPLQSPRVIIASASSPFFPRCRKVRSAPKI